MKNLFVLAILSLLVLSACKKEEQEEPFIAPVVRYTVDGKQEVIDGLYLFRMEKRQSGLRFQFNSRPEFFIETFEEKTYQFGGDNINEVNYFSFYTFTSYASDKIVGELIIEEIDEAAGNFSGKFSYKLKDVSDPSITHEITDGEFINIPIESIDEFCCETSIISIEENSKSYFFWKTEVSKRDDQFIIKGRNTLNKRFNFAAPLNLQVGKYSIEEIDNFNLKYDDESPIDTKGFLDIIQNDESYMEINFELELKFSSGDSTTLKNGNLKYFKKP